MNSPSSVPNVPIRVLCVDDHPVVRRGLQQTIDAEPDMQVIAMAGTGAEAVSLFLKHEPDVTLMDLQLPGMSGIEVIRQIRNRCAGARIVVLSMYAGDEDISQAMKAGAQTYLLKDCVCDDLVRTIRDVHHGKRPVLESVAKRLAEWSDSPHLAPREIQIIELLAAGMRNKEIAGALGIAEDTVHAHFRHIFAKLRVTDRTGALATAVRRGIIHVPAK